MKKLPKVAEKSSVSIEKLSHFRCGHCNKWWSIADAPTKKKEWWCPWCGKKLE
jgi:hypothetical protein